MHEMSLAEGVLQLIEEAAQREDFAQVKTVWLEIGQLACVEPQALAFCFEVVTRGSIVDGARLEIISTPGFGCCLACAATVPMAEIHALCPRCGSGPLQASGGTEMRVKELEVE